jgi:hypothetical protein
VLLAQRGPGLTERELWLEGMSEGYVGGRGREAPTERGSEGRTLLDGAAEEAVGVHDEV